MMLYIVVGVAIMVAFYAYLVRSALRDPYELHEDEVDQIVPDVVESDEVKRGVAPSVPGFGFRTHA